MSELDRDRIAAAALAVADEHRAAGFTMRAVAEAAVGALRRSHQVWTDSMLPVTERWFSVWQQSDLDLDRAVAAGVSSSLAIAGLVEAEMRFAEERRPGADQLGLLPNARLAFLGSHDRDANFELAARGLIDGMHARLADGAGE